MPTWATTPRFDADLRGLTREQRTRFRRVVRERFVPDIRSGQFRDGLRVKGVEGMPGAFEMSWDGDGRGVFTYGTEVKPGETHVIWLRVGTHSVLP